MKLIENNDKIATVAQYGVVLKETASTLTKGWGGRGTEQIDRVQKTFQY